MAAQSTVTDIPDDQHPAVLLARAHELVNEADELDRQVEELRAKARELRVQSGVMRARAARLRDGEHLAPPKRKAEPPDPLMAAAGLAVEDFMGVFTTREFMDVLQLRSEDRALKLLRSLRDMDLITEVGEDWRTWEVGEARVRDTLRDLGTCSQAELAEALDV